MIWWKIGLLLNLAAGPALVSAAVPVVPLPPKVGSTKAIKAEDVIKALKLVPLDDKACPGYFLSSYESATRAVSPKGRRAASLIYYFMPPTIKVDPWHLLVSDEILLYHAGAPMVQLLLYPDGRWEEVTLGAAVEKGEVPQKLIPAGTWMAFTRQDDPRCDWGLYGVLCVPGWHADDIRMAGEAEIRALMVKYPGAVARGRALGLFPR